MVFHDCAFPEEALRSHSTLGMSKEFVYRYADQRANDPGGPNLPGYQPNRGNTWIYVSSITNYLGDLVDLLYIIDTASSFLLSCSSISHHVYGLHSSADEFFLSTLVF